MDEASNSESTLATPRSFPGRVANVQDEFDVVINRGREDGVKAGQRFLVYAVTDTEIIDPETGVSLGYLEVNKGTGKVIHLQDLIATVRSDRVGAARTRSLTPFERVAQPLWGFNEEAREPGRPVPFDDPEVGDLVKPV